MQTKRIDPGLSPRLVELLYYYALFLRGGLAIHW